MPNLRMIVLASFVASGLAGCEMSQPAAETLTAPRPVTVFTLRRSDPARSDRVAASVASWKTESIGFEVAGRVEFVVEPETDVTGRMYAENQDLFGDPTVIARLDPSRYELEVQGIQADIEANRQQEEALKIEIDQVFPARKRAAEAERDLAQTEVERNEKLVSQSAAPERALDLARSKLEGAVAQLAQVEAQQEAKRSERASLVATRDQLEQSLAEARRNVADCTLYSPYSGQAAEVHVIPGGFVERGEPVVTVQLMDPITLELEVSRETLKRLRFRDQLSVFIPQADGSLLQRKATVYLTDPVADSKTRTFTVTLLTPNEKVSPGGAAEVTDQPVAETTNIWRLVSRTVDGTKLLFVDENSFQEDDQGTFLWKITNRTLGTLAADASPRLEVTKLRVEKGRRRVDFLGGLFTFQEVSFDPEQELDVESVMVTGKMIYPPGTDASQWDGGTVLFRQERWLLRPGDLVAVDLSGRPAQPGFYVPLDAILDKGDRTYVFVLDGSGEQPRARQVEVRAGETVGTRRRIESVGEGALEEGSSRIILGGALFLMDGEAVNVTREVEGN